MAAGIGKLFSKGLSNAAQTGSKAAKNKNVSQAPLGKTSRSERRAQRNAEAKLNNTGNTGKTNPPPPPPPLPPAKPQANSNINLKATPSNGITPQSLAAGKQNLAPVPPAAAGSKTFGQKAKGLATSTFGQVIGGTLVGSALLAGGTYAYNQTKGGDQAGNAGSGSAGYTGNSGGYSSYDSGSYGSNYGVPGSYYA